MDETYLKVAGRWRYVYRAIDQFGQVIDVLVSARRDAKAAHRFFERAISATKVTPVEVTTDRAPAYPAVLEELVPAAWHGTDRYANNRVECDHGRLKARLRAMRGRKEDRSAKVITRGLDSYRTFGEDTTSWRWTSQRAAGWLSRSTSWPWRSDLKGRELQHAADSPNGTVPFRRVNGHLHLPALRIALEATAATAVTSTKEDAA